MATRVGDDVALAVMYRVARSHQPAVTGMVAVTWKTGSPRLGTTVGVMVPVKAAELGTYTGHRLVVGTTLELTLRV